jgi:hypothetical protein
MSNVVEPTSPTLNESMPAPGRPDKDRVLGSGRRLLATAAQWPRSDSSTA